MGALMSGPWPPGKKVLTRLLMPIRAELDWRDSVHHW
jgi:hypothetical protein